MNGKLREYMNESDIRSCGKHVIMGMAETAWERFNADDAKIASRGRSGSVNIKFTTKRQKLYGQANKNNN